MTPLISPSTWHGRERMGQTSTTGQSMIWPSAWGTIMFGTSSSTNSSNSLLIQQQYPMMIGRRALLTWTRLWIRQNSNILLTTIIIVRHLRKEMFKLSPKIRKLQRLMSNMKILRPIIGTDAPCFSRFNRCKRPLLTVSASISELVRVN